MSWSKGKPFEITQEHLDAKWSGNIYCRTCRFYTCGRAWSLGPWLECIHPKNWKSSAITEKAGRSWEPCEQNGENDCSLYLYSRTNKEYQWLRVMWKNLNRFFRR